MTEIEGENEDNTSNKDKLTNAFITLLVDLNKDKLGEQYSDSYFTSIKNFFLTKLLVIFYTILYVKTLINNLNNQALIY
jgi:hypothetical protein